VSDNAAIVKSYVGCTCACAGLHVAAATETAGVDLTGLPPGQAYALGEFTGDLVADAEARGYQRAVDAVRAVRTPTWGLVDSEQARTLDAGAHTMRDVILYALTAEGTKP
jgi:hypothetical protein